MSEPVFDSNSSTRIWELLTALKDWIKARWARNPYSTAAGKIAAGQRTGAVYTHRVTFPAGRFTVAPIVTVTIDNAAGGFQPLQAVVQTTTADYADVVFALTSGNLAATWCTATWVAVQMTSTTAEG